MEEDGTVLEASLDAGDMEARGPAETVVAAIQAGLAHREARRATPAETAAAATTGEVDLDKVNIPASLKDVVEEKPVAKKRASRTGAHKSAVTTDEV